MEGTLSANEEWDGPSTALLELARRFCVNLGQDWQQTTALYNLLADKHRFQRRTQESLKSKFCKMGGFNDDSQPLQYSDLMNFDFDDVNYSQCVGFR